MEERASGADAAKAYRLRKALQAGTIGPIDKLWLADYEERAERRKKRRAEAFGASRSQSGRKVKFEMEEAEQSEAIGTGTAAAAAASAALVAKEEGRRLDSLTIESVNALKEAVAVYRDVCQDLRRQVKVYAETQVEMFEAVREQYLARTQAEINALEAQSQNGDPLMKLADEFLPHVLKNGGNGRAPG
jgi:hypothetical protein